MPGAVSTTPGSDAPIVVNWSNKIKSRQIEVAVPKKFVDDDEIPILPDEILRSAPLDPNEPTSQNNRCNKTNQRMKKERLPKKKKSVINTEDKVIRIGNFADKVEDGDKMSPSSQNEQVDEIRKDLEHVRLGGSGRGSKRSVLTKTQKKKPRFEPVAILFDVATNGDLIELKRLLSRSRIPINSTNSSDQTPLHCAVANGHVEIVEFLLENGAKVNVSDEKGWTPLLMAIANDDLEISKLLLSHNADVEVSAVDNHTPLSLSTLLTRSLVEKMLYQKYHAKECVAMYDFDPHIELSKQELVGDELPFLEGELLTIVKRGSEEDWWLAENVFGKRGFIPKTHVQ
jgi:ankyrin repeat protein